jgi:two-component system, chemotaxis family, sensor kinase CheA
MSLDADEEILQDFLIEAGEILETMSEQLVALENQPEDMDLLNGIFRGFHTVKGGAGFLALEPLVEICHITENIFDILRNGGRSANADLMDQILSALDIVNEMFDDVRAGNYPEHADPAFLEKLGTYACADDGVEEPKSVQDTQTENRHEQPASDEITDEEFDNLLNEINSPSVSGSASKPPVSSASTNDSQKPTTNTDEISDDEFEALLDELHGEGGFNVSGGSAISTPTATNLDNNNSKASSKAAGANDDITDDEFEALLDELHGKGSPITKSTESNQTKSSTSSDDQIKDDEFEALLDELHGSGKGPVAASGSKSSQPASTQSSAAPSTPSSSTAKQPAAKPKVPPASKPAPAASKTAAKPAAKKITQGTTPEATVRVDTKRLDDIMNMVGELVLARNRLKTLGQNNQDENLNKAISNLDIVTADLQGAVMKTRMQPIKKVFGRFPRVVRDLARSLKKDIKLEMVGEETDLDKNLVEALADPLVHLVRNSVDHGVESPEDRIAAGKSPNGTIVLSAAQEGDHIMLSIEDDGKGMDPDFLRGLAVDKGLMDREQADRLTDSECYNLIFMAGFSTKKEISDISGRGVGMDVVKTKITQLNGSITIESILGKGTKIMIKVPLTLAILHTLMVKVRDQSFALPLTSVNEIFHLDLTKTNTVDGQLVIVVREKALPLFFLNEWLAKDSHFTERDQEGHVILIQVGTQRLGFVVDSLIGQEEVVIKPLGKSLQGTPGMAGATITSDGGIALIIDIPSLLKHYAG